MTRGGRREADGGAQEKTRTPLKDAGKHSNHERNKRSKPNPPQSIPSDQYVAC